MSVDQYSQFLNDPDTKIWPNPPKSSIVKNSPKNKQSETMKLIMEQIKEEQRQIKIQNALAAGKVYVEPPIITNYMATRQQQDNIIPPTPSETTQIQPIKSICCILM
jgi:hypothetical protein